VLEGAWARDPGCWRVPGPGILGAGGCLGQGSWVLEGAWARGPGRSNRRVGVLCIINGSYDDDGVVTLRSPIATSRSHPGSQTKVSVNSRPCHPHDKPGTTYDVASILAHDWAYI
jgi:hypothetical protein